jgi:hypothetical protein
VRFVSQLSFQHVTSNVTTSQIRPHTQHHLAPRRFDGRWISEHFEHSYLPRPELTLAPFDGPLSKPNTGDR